MQACIEPDVPGNTALTPYTWLAGILHTGIDVDSAQAEFRHEASPPRNPVSLSEGRWCWCKWKRAAVDWEGAKAGPRQGACFKYIEISDMHFWEEALIGWGTGIAVAHLQLAHNPA